MVKRIMLLHSICSAAQYLISMQAPDGHWQEYTLPVGASDAWITAYVGFSLAEVSHLPLPIDNPPEALSSARKASAWLHMNRPYAAGWGFNCHTGPDSDSTAWAIRLFRAIGDVTPAKDLDFLRKMQSEDGGFSTYIGLGHWGSAHPDVTPVVFLALQPCLPNGLKAKVLTYIWSARVRDGTWPSYWWRTNHYSTFQNVELFYKLGIPDQSVLPVISDEDTHRIYSSFDLACALGVAALRQPRSRLEEALSRELFRLQDKNGQWQGAQNLRVTTQECSRPWIHPSGKYYADTTGLITTATALRALCFLLNGLRDG